MATTSRRISQRTRTAKPSTTKGKDKGESCKKSPLKTWGMNAKPHKFSGSDAQRYANYCSLIDGLNKTK